MIDLLDAMIEYLNNGTPLVLASILTRNGSAPRTAGAKMLVLPDGSIVGTIGGGQLEGKSIQFARQVHVDHFAVIKEFFMTGKDAASSDMICGGNQEVLLEYLDPSDAQLKAALEAMRASAKARQSAWWITDLPSDRDKIQRVGHVFINRSGQIVAFGDGNPILEPLIQINPPTAGEKPELRIGGKVMDLESIRESGVFTWQNRRYSIDPIDVYGTVYIFGCGHVSQKLAPLTQTVGFRTVVLDDRPEFANRGRFPSVDEIIVLDSYKECFKSLTLDPFTYFVIVTRGHLADQEVLVQALKTEAVYIGMIGSKRKCETIYKALLADGFSQEDIQRVHGPIGIAIEAESPEEIAVSITGELILERSKILKQK
jgi:xanthine dehydrogenase accessory factor